MKEDTKVEEIPLVRQCNESTANFVTNKLTCHRTSGLSTLLELTKSLLPPTEINTLYTKEKVSVALRQCNTLHVVKRSTNLDFRLLVN